MDQLNIEKRRIACVTGATAVIGKKIVSELKIKDLHIRILTRKNYQKFSGVEVFEGQLENRILLDRFLSNADYLFHCAGETKDPSKMAAVNIQGTKNLITAAQKNNLKYFCHISSAGVIGKSKNKIITEDSECNPQNLYEQTKYEAEKLAKMKIPNCSTVILRPINVVSKEEPGAFLFPIRNSFKDRFVVFLKGSENSHSVHAQQIADCAIYFMNQVFEKPEIFFVGNEKDLSNTYRGVWNVYCEQSGKIKQKMFISLPIWIPYLIRKLKGTNANSGNILYSSDKLESYGFTDNWDIDRICKMLINKDV